MLKIMITGIAGSVPREMTSKEILDIVDNLLKPVFGDAGREFFGGPVNPL
jgi:hypothetical protein